MANGDVSFRQLFELTGDFDRIHALLRDAHVELEQNAALLDVALGEFERVNAYADLIRDTPMALESKQAAWYYVLETTRHINSTIDGLVTQQRLCNIVRRLLVARALAVARRRVRGLFPAVLLAGSASAVVVHAASGRSVVPGFSSFVRFSVLMLRFLLGAI